MQNIQFIQITPQQLQEAILEGVKKQLDELKTEFQPKTPTEFLTRQEVSELLKIDLSTVHNWSRSGRLKRHAIGNRIYFKRREIEEAMVLL